MRRNITLARRQEAREGLYTKLEQHIAEHEKILSFASFDDEVDLSLLNQLLELQGKLHLCYVEENHLIPYKVTNMAKELQLDKNKFFEPNPNKCQRATHFDLILVPGIAFDAKGTRLGFGKGYYDRLLSRLPSCLTIGVGFQEQFSHKPLPRDHHDVAVGELCLV